MGYVNIYTWERRNRASVLFIECSQKSPVDFFSHKSLLKQAEMVARWSMLHSNNRTPVLSKSLLPRTNLQVWTTKEAFPKLPSLGIENRPISMANGNSLVAFITWGYDVTLCPKFWQRKHRHTEKMKLRISETLILQDRKQLSQNCDMVVCTC